MRKLLQRACAYSLDTRSGSCFHNRFCKQQKLTDSFSVVTNLGDLSMSVIKRICGIKDCDKFLPGHVEILIRLYDTLFTAPLTLVFYNIFKSSGGLFPMVL